MHGTTELRERVVGGERARDRNIGRGRASVSERVFVVANDHLLRLFHRSAKRVDRDLTERTLFCSRVVDTVERTAWHLHADLGEDLLQLRNIIVIVNVLVPYPYPYRPRFV